MTGESGRVEGVEIGTRTLRTSGGVALRLRSWTPADGIGPTAGRIVLVHGLGDHAGRYDEFARRAASRGFRVLGYDQRGHGASEGRRGVGERFDDFVRDLDEVVAEAREALPGSGETVLLGHSMGGLVVLRYLQTRTTDVGGAVLSAPWLATSVRIPAWKRWASRLLARLAPSLTLAAGVDPEHLTRDPVRQREHREDPLVHDRISAGLHRAVLEAQARALTDPLPSRIPLLLLVPLDDPLADPHVTREWARNLPGATSVELLAGGRHEPLNDVDRSSVTDTLLAWIEGISRENPGPASGYADNSRPGRAAPSSGRGGELRRHASRNHEGRSETMSEKPTSDHGHPGDDVLEETDEPADEGGFETRTGGEDVEDPVDQADLDDEGFEGADIDGLDWDDGDEDDPMGEDFEDLDGLDDLDDNDFGGAADLQDELEELNDRHLRLAAEFNNFRRRHETQMTEAWGRAQADLLGRLLDVLDDLQRVSALDPADEAVTVESIVEGIDMVERKFVRAVAEAGAEIVDPVEGDAFDPERMEAMMRVEDESGDRDDQVAAVFQKGYLFKGNLVRPARVSVYKG